MTDKEPIYIVAGCHGFKDERQAAAFRRFVVAVGGSLEANYGVTVLEMHTSAFDAIMDVWKQVKPNE